jgi:hypothetical protein
MIFIFYLMYIDYLSDFNQEDFFDSYDLCII